MITEDYVSYEVAKLLKEKGFDKFNTYGWDEQLFDKDHPRNFSIGFDNKEHWISCPTHQMAMKWLREVHKLTFIISPQWAEGDMRNPCRWYWEIKGLEDINIDVYNNPLCNTYEEAVEAACIYSLENLI